MGGSWGTGSATQPLLPRTLHVCQAPGRALRVEPGVRETPVRETPVPHLLSPGAWQGGKREQISTESSHYKLPGAPSTKDAVLGEHSGGPDPEMGQSRDLEGDGSDQRQKIKEREMELRSPGRQGRPRRAREGAP